MPARPEKVQYYWVTPALYERDRPLYRRICPIITALLEAGWQPVTHARTNSPQLFVERYGPAADGSVFFTVWNDSRQPQRLRLRIDARAIGLPEKVHVRELAGASTPAVASATGSLIISDTVGPLRLRVYCLTPRRRATER